MARFIGELISSSRSPGVETQVINVQTEEIESLLRSRFEKDGWEASFDWLGSQWPVMVVTRRREVKS